jgi:hypothetical protein
MFGLDTIIAMNAKKPTAKPEARKLDHTNLGAEIYAASLESKHSVVVNPYFPDQKHYFNLGTREAAIAAFALYTMGNHHEDQWESAFSSLVVKIAEGHLCGNWKASAAK